MTTVSQVSSDHRQVHSEEVGSRSNPEVRKQVNGIHGHMQAYSCSAAQVRTKGKSLSLRVVAKQKVVRKPLIGLLFRSSSFTV